MVGSYAVGDVRALVPARKAVWSLPGEPKGFWENFLPSICLYCILTLFFAPFSCFITVHLKDNFYYISSLCLYCFCLPLFSLFSSFLALPYGSQPVE